MSQENLDTASVGVDLNSVMMKKVGMTRIFDSNGNHQPVTVLSLEQAHVLQVKTSSNDGYSSVKFGYDAKRPKLVSAPVNGELKKAKVEESYSKMAETKIAEGQLSEDAVGSIITFKNLEVGKLVNVSGVTKGKGFAGVVKRYGFAGGRRVMAQNSTELLVRLVIEQHLVKFGKVKKCLVIWVQKNKPLKI